MSHSLTIKHLGPITECYVDFSKFTILTGPQSNGKSTIAKASFFFRTIKQDILQIMLQGGPAAVTGFQDARWDRVLTQRLKDKFMQLFGTSWVMPQDMRMEYQYDTDTFIHVFLSEGNNENNFINIEYSPSIIEYFISLENHVFRDMTMKEKERETAQLENLFADPYETVFIPAGRNLITLLSTQLNYIFTSLEGSQLRNIDYVTKRYTELILRLKPTFTVGLEALWQNAKEGKKYTRDQESAVNLLIKDANAVLCGSYRYEAGEERLYLDERRYVKINLSSSGQQEVVWVFNLLFYYLLENKKTFLIVEEPESHLYPESQRIMGEVLSLFSNCGNEILVTTHSPYLLGTFNYLLMAFQCPQDKQENIKKKIHKRKWLDSSETTAFFTKSGKLVRAMETDEGITLIQNSRIDGASDTINERNDLVLYQFAEEEVDD